MITATVAEKRNEASVRRELRVGSARTFYDIAGDLLPPPSPLHDFALIATIFYAMRSGEPLHIAGPVSSILLQNIEEFQEAWALWRPADYRVIEVTADEERSCSLEAHKQGVFAFSGGVDGTFALLRHYFKDAGKRTCKPKAMMLVHGFDIPLSQSAAFETTVAAARKTANKLELPLSTVRTDWKSALCKNWELEFAAGLTACLHQFAGVAGVGVFGADEDYAHIELPWGSNPATNHLLSGAFRIHSEGAGFTRTERVRYIASHPEFAAGLRVCWEGPATGSNCGKCEKCVRTKLNFMATNMKPICFDDDASLGQVLGIKARTPIQIAYLQDIKEASRRHKVSGVWPKALAVSIAKNQLLLPTRTLEKRLRKAASQLIRR